MKAGGRFPVTRLLFLLPIVLAGLLLWQLWPIPRETAYHAYRERGRVRTLERLEGYERMAGSHYEIWYTEADRGTAPMILQTAEHVYDQVTARLGYRPPGLIPIILYPGRAELREAFGWGNSESAMGVYWAGTIRLLSPNAWIPGRSQDDQARVFARLNPIAHELTHYILDYLTAGNYPRWFTEGLAQRVEHEVTGFLWLEQRSTLRQQLYSLEELERRFDQLTNQPLAYRQSFLMVQYMAESFGEEGLTSLIEQLARGIPFHRAVRLQFGLGMDDLYDRWLSWVETHLDQLDQTS